MFDEGALERGRGDGRAEATVWRRDRLVLKEERMRHGLAWGCLLLAGLASRAPESRAAPGPETEMDAAAQDRLVRAAEAALALGPFSVMQKARVPPSGDRHDFLSLAPYWWPDPSRPDGLPYIRRDGEVNPESKRGTDDAAFDRMSSSVATLAEAYRATREERFAARAALQLRVWFLDPATKMNPNLNYGQAVPGRNQGRGAGIVATRRLVRVVDAVRVLAPSPAWSVSDRAGLQAWCAGYARWLRASRNGREEASAKNNHGTWYDAQLVALLLYTGRRDEARGVIEASAKQRIAAQIQADGRQPEELQRTRAWSYSVMNLDGWFTIARLADEVGIDLWHYRAQDGRSLRGALDYLVPFAEGTARWPHPQITPFGTDELVPLLRQAAVAWRSDRYAALADRLQSAALAVAEPTDRLAEIVAVTARFVQAALPAEAGASLSVEAATRPGQPWMAFPTRTLDRLPARAATLDAPACRYGGNAATQLKASGVFRAEKVAGRFWLVDPDGHLFVSKGVVSVNMAKPAGAREAVAAKFGSDAAWAAKTTAFLREHGFNSLGAWSDTERLRALEQPLAYTRIWSFMASYGKKRGGTYQQAGHTGYPNDSIFVFDPEFETFADEYAKQLAQAKDDPWLLGHFSDNELPLKLSALKSYLALPAGDPGHVAAKAWLVERRGPNAAAAMVSDEDEQEFLFVVAERYFRIVSKAIRKYDPNHLYLGPRLHGNALRMPEIFRAAAPHVDVIAVNWYHAWTPDATLMGMWERESGRPCLVTEWYAKAVDSGMGNTSGAGWLVQTQRDRGRFYQNFALALLESRSCVGWQWFRYADNDPDDTSVDPSNRDANKGIVTNRYEPYAPLLDAMKSLNQRAYSLIEHFDRALSAAAGSI